MKSLNKSPLTKRQQEIYDIIRKFVRKFHVSPSIREICDAADIVSMNGVRCHLKVLEKKGYITRRKYSSRSIVLKKSKPAMKKEVNFYREIREEQLLSLSEERLSKMRGKKIVCRKNEMQIFISDESFSFCGIREGDYLVVRRATHFHEGDRILVHDVQNRIYLVRVGKYTRGTGWEFFLPTVQDHPTPISNPTLVGIVLYLVRVKF